MIQEKIFLEEEKNVWIKTYILDLEGDFNKDKKYPVIVICPGGGYAFLSEREMEPVAVKFNSIGYHAIILGYSIGKKAANRKPIIDAARAIQLIRENADDWKIDRDCIFMCGFSAGGHVVASLGVYWNSDFLKENLKGSAEEWKPDALVLAYPLIDLNEVNRRLPYIDNFSMANKDIEEKSYVYKLSEKKYIDFKLLTNSYLFGDVNVDKNRERELCLNLHVDENTTPAFLWHTSMDNLIFPGNSIKFAVELDKRKIPYELHIFGVGYHGLSLASKITAQGENGIVPECQIWVDLADSWLRNLKSN